MTRTKKAAIGLLLVLMLTTQFVIGAFAYSDVADDAWYAGVVNRFGHLLADGNNANPTVPITRGEFAYCLNTLFKFPAAKATFSDVSGHKYAADIGALQTAGVVDGVGDNKYDPDAVLTRAQAGKMVALAIGLEEVSGSLKYKDADKIPSYVSSYVKALTEGGYFNGDPKGYFLPDQLMNRAYIYQVMNNIAPNYVTDTAPLTKVVNGNLLVTAPGAVIKDVKVSGDIIIAPSVGNGEVTLDGVSLTGTLIVRGGGVNSIIIKGDSTIARVFVEKSGEGGVRVVTEGNAAVAAIIVNDGSDKVIIEGSVGELVVATSGVSLEINATVANLNITAPEATVSVGEKASVESIYVAPAATEATLAVAGTVKDLQIAAPAAEVAVAATATVATVGVSGSAVGASVANSGTITELTVKSADAVVANTGKITEAALPTTVTVTGTAANHVTETSAGSQNDTYVQ